MATDGRKYADPSKVAGGATVAATNPFKIKPQDPKGTVTPPPSGIIGSQIPQVAAPDPTTSVQTVNSNPFAGATANTYSAAAADSRGYNATNTGAEGYTADKAAAERWNVDDNQLVRKQLEGVLAENSPLLQRANAQALQQANARGLLNSSMAVGASTGAVMDRALQIATPDAQTYGEAARTNAQLGTQTNISNAGFENTARGFAANANNQAAIENARAANQAAQFGANAANQASIFNTGEANTAGRFNAGEANTLQRQALQTEAETARFNAAAANEANAQKANLALQAGLANQDAAVKTALTEYDAAFKASMANADAANKLQLQELDANVRQSLLAMEAQYKNQMQSNQSVANLYSQTIDSITKIMQDPNLDAAAKDALIKNQFELMRNGVVLIGATANIEGLEDLVNFDFKVPDSAGGPNATPAPAPAPNPYNPYDPSVPDHIRNGT